MEILPGVGFAGVCIGDPRDAVDSRLGTPAWCRDSRRYYEPSDVLVDFDDDDRVELIEVPYRDDGRAQPSLGGVVLTYRCMDDVVQELASHGHVGEPSDIGYDFPAGFAIWSMSSLSAHEVDPALSEDDDRLVVEGVSIAPYAYFARNR